MDPTWRHPFTSIFAGPSHCGKTTFTFKFLKHVENMITPCPEKIIYCYGEFQENFNDYPNVTIMEGLPDIEQFDGKHRTLLIMDDLMTETNDSVSNIFTKISSSERVGDLSHTKFIQ